jgi:hypothetical protein
MQFDLFGIDCAAKRLEVSLMRDKRSQSRIATVTKLPSSRRPGRRYKTLTSAVGASASERDVLEVLRRMLASRLSGDDRPTAAAFAALVKQFREVEAQIRALDLADTLAADDESADDDDDDEIGENGWDPSKL